MYPIDGSIVSDPSINARAGQRTTKHVPHCLQQQGNVYPYHSHTPWVVKDDLFCGGDHFAQAALPRARRRVAEGRTQGWNGIDAAYRALAPSTACAHGLWRPGYQLLPPGAAE